MKTPPLTISVQAWVPRWTRHGYEMTRAYAETHLRKRRDNVPAVVDALARKVVAEVTRDYA